MLEESIEKLNISVNSGTIHLEAALELGFWHCARRIFLSRTGKDLCPMDLAILKKGFDTFEARKFAASGMGMSENRPFDVAKI